MSDIPNPSRRHHHVWQHYLSKWTENDTIWCLQDRKKIFKTGTTVVAVETDFYKLQNISLNDIDFIRSIFSNSHPMTQRNNESLMAKLLYPFALVRKAESEGDAKMVTIFSAFAERWAFEVLEMHHSNVEIAAIPLLDLALKGDLSFDHDERAINFYYYLATQHLRTKGVKSGMLAAFENSGVDMSKLWNIMIPMSATTLGSSLYLRRHTCQLSIIYNDTELPFITGDQPAVNLLSDKTKAGVAPEMLSLYYPISPKMAIIIPEVDEPPMFPERGISADDVKKLNNFVAKSCHRQIFSSNKRSLEDINLR